MKGSRRILGEIAYSLVRWGIFAVALSLLPILMRALGSVTRGDPVGFVSLFSGGELLLVSAAIVGSALADLVTVGGPRFRTARLAAGGAAGFVGIIASAWFADIAAGRRDGSTLDPEAIAVGSVVVFASAVVAGISCIALAELGKEG